MNWRGRPLTSHEVVVQTIASTRTRPGLRVDAELDTRDYPLGVSVSRARMQALPIEPHPCHGTWNYTIHPTAKDKDGVDGRPATSATNGARQRHRAQALAMLSDPLLTGMRRHDLDALTARLASAQAAQTEQRCYQQRGGPRRKAAGAHGRPLLSDADHVLITIVYLRQICSQKVLSELLEVNPFSVGQAIAETRQLLDEHRHTVIPTTLRFTSQQALLDFVHHGNGTTVTRPHLPEALSDPSLTGMSRPKLHQLIERLSVPQAAQIERRRHQRRGGARLPGARGGVFRQKITDAEQILATILYQRGVCTRHVLAELFEVSPRTIGNALLEVRPLLDVRRPCRHARHHTILHRSSASRLRHPITGQHTTPQPPG